VSSLKIRAKKGLRAFGLKQKDIADALGLSPPSVYLVLGGRGESQSVIAKTAEMIQCSVEWLRYGTGEPPSWASNDPDILTSERISTGIKELYGSVEAASLNSTMSVEEINQYMDNRFEDSNEYLYPAVLVKASKQWILRGFGDPPEWAKAYPHLTQPKRKPTPESDVEVYHEKRLRVGSHEMRIPVGGTVTAGSGWSHNDDEDGVSIKVPSGLIAVKIEGQSAEPLVEDGQYVLADPNIDTSDIPIDAIVVVQTPLNEAYCKRFSGMKNGNLFLTSVNQGRGSIIVDDEGCRVMQVVGVLF
jgi:hypothetical protein